MHNVTGRRFSVEWRKVLEKTENLFIWQEQAKSLIIEDEKVRALRRAFGTKFYSEAVILTNGTFLNGLMHVGFKNVKGGRSGEQSSTGLSEQLREMGFSVERLKTGTSARIDGRNIDFQSMTEQKGDTECKNIFI